MELRKETSAETRAAIGQLMQARQELADITTALISTDTLDRLTLEAALRRLRAVGEGGLVPPGGRA